MNKLNKPTSDDKWLVDGINDLSHTLVGYTEISVVVVAPITVNGLVEYVMQIMISSDPRKAIDDKIIIYKVLDTDDFESASATAQDIFSNMIQYYDTRDLLRFLRTEDFRLRMV